MELSDYEKLVAIKTYLETKPKTKISETRYSYQGDIEFDFYKKMLEYLLHYVFRPLFITNYVLPYLSKYLSVLKDTQAKNKAELKELETKTETDKKTKEQLSAKIKELNKMSKELENTIRTMEEERKEIRGDDKEGIEGKHQLLSIKVAAAENTLLDLKGELPSKITKLQSEISGLTKEIEELEQEINIINSKKGIKGLKKDNSTRKHYNDIYAQIKKEKKTKKKQIVMIMAINVIINKINENITQFKKERKEKEEELNEIKLKLENIENTLKIGKQGNKVCNEKIKLDDIYKKNDKQNNKAGTTVEYNKEIKLDDIYNLNIKACKLKLIEYQDEMEYLKKEIEAKNKKLNKKKEELENKKTVLTQLEKQIKDLKADYMRKNKLLTEINSDLQKIKNSLEVNKEYVDRIEKEEEPKIYVELQFATERAYYYFLLQDKINKKARNLREGETRDLLSNEISNIGSSRKQLRSYEGIKEDIKSVLEDNTIDNEKKSLKSVIKNDITEKGKMKSLTLQEIKTDTEKIEKVLETLLYLMNTKERTYNQILEQVMKYINEKLEEVKKMYSDDLTLNEKQDNFYNILHGKDEFTKEEVNKFANPYKLSYKEEIAGKAYDVYRNDLKKDISDETRNYFLFWDILSIYLDKVEEMDKKIAEYIKGKDILTRLRIDKAKLEQIKEKEKKEAETNYSNIEMLIRTKKLFRFCKYLVYSLYTKQKDINAFNDVIEKISSVDDSESELESDMKDRKTLAAVKQSYFKKLEGSAEFLTFKAYFDNSLNEFFRD